MLILDGRTLLKDKNRDITVSLTGGLGNQLFQIACGLYYSEGHGISVLGSLGRPRQAINGRLSSLQFNFHNQVRLIPTESVSLFWAKCAGFILRRSINQKNYERFLGLGKMLDFVVRLLLLLRLKKQYRFLCGSGVGDCTLNPKNSSNLLFGYFQSDKWLSDTYVKDTLDRISLDGEELILEHFRNKAIHDVPLVVHFRLGDYKNEPEIGLLPAEYYFRAIAEISKTREFGKIWLFSDEPEAALSKMPVEFKSQTEMIQIPGNNDALTLQVMRYGTGYVLSNSTFGWWSARLSHSNNPSVIVPDRWFKALPEPKGLIPSDWLRIRAWD